MSENPAAPALALLGEIEVIEGFAGQPPQETTGSNKIAYAPKSTNLVIAIGLQVRQISERADSQGQDFERIISVAIQLVGRIDDDYIAGCPFPASFARRGIFEFPFKAASLAVQHSRYSRQRAVADPERPVEFPGEPQSPGRQSQKHHIRHWC